MKRLFILIFPLLLLAPTHTFYCDQGWGYYYWLFGPIGPSQSEGLAAAGFQSVEYRGYAQFDLYGYPGSGTTINSLSLRLRNNTGGSGLQIDLNRVTSGTPSWEECGATAPIYATNLSVNSNPDVYTYFDLSGTQAIDDFLTAWEAGTWFGLGMKGSRGTGEPCMHFFYAFWADEYYDAALLVDYGIVGMEEYHDPNSKIQEPRISIEPNPACDKVNIRVNNAKTGGVGEMLLRIYTCTGQVVRTFSLSAPCGDQSTVMWDCTDMTGRRAVPGIYFVKLSCGNRSTVEKFILLE